MDLLAIATDGYITSGGNGGPVTLNIYEDLVVQLADDDFEVELNEENYEIELDDADFIVELDDDEFEVEVS